MMSGNKPHRSAERHSFMTPQRILAAASVSAAVVFSSGMAHTQTVSGLAEANDALETAPWNNRLLVVCTSAAAEDGVADPPLMTAQYEAMLDDVEGFLERDLILVWVSPEYIISWKPVPNTRDDMVATLLVGSHNDDPTGLREQVGCFEPDDEVTLIGKDTGIKQVWKGDAPTQEVFAAIDAMPMRQREMRD